MFLMLQVANATWLFYIAKFIELLDTVRLTIVVYREGLVAVGRWYLVTLSAGASF